MAPFVIIAQGTTKHTDGSLLELQDLTEYYWKVEAVDNFGTIGTSEVFWFKTNYTNCFMPTHSGTINRNNTCRTCKINIDANGCPTITCDC